MIISTKRHFLIILAVHLLLRSTLYRNCFFFLYIIYLDQNFKTALYSLVFALDYHFSLVSYSDKIQKLKKALEYVNRLNATNCENGTADTLALRLDPTIWDTYANVAVKTANFLSKYLQLNAVNGSLLSDWSESTQQPESKRAICSNLTWLQLQRQFSLREQENTNISGTSVNRSRLHSIGDVNIHMLLYLLVQNNIDTDSPVIFGSAVAFEPYVIPCLEKYSPYAHKMQKNGVYVGNLASKYNYLDSSVQWYFPVKAKVVQRRIKTKRIKYG